MADHYYVYPEYLIGSGPRSLGRRVPRALSSGEVSLEEIVRAATSLGYSAEAEPAKSYPRQFYRYQGRVKIAKQKGVRKTILIRALAAELKKAAPAAQKS